MTQGLQTTLPYTLGAYMVRDFLGSSADEAAVGQLTGLLSAVFCGAQLMTSFPLGRLSDSIGRKPLIVVGNISCVVFILAFGLAGSFSSAVAARAAGGALNGIIGAEKAIIGKKLRSPDHQATAMGLISLAWGIGSLIGPMLGGILSRPCVEGGVLHGGHFCEAGSVLDRRPYLLPCIAAALFSAVATLLTAGWLDESLPRRDAVLPAAYCPVLHDEESAELELTSQLSAPSPVQVEDSAELHSRDSRGSGQSDVGGVKATEPLESGKGDPVAVPWHKQSNVRLCLAGYASTAFTYILLDELTPIFASAPVSLGGLGFPTISLAAPLSFGGAVLTLWALCGFSWLHRRLGGVRTCVHGLWQTVPMAMLIPLSSLSALPSQPVMWAAMGLKAVASVNAFTASIILVNAVSPVGELGSVNGLGQMLASAARALGPALGGISWAASLKLFARLGLAPWGHQFLPFGIAAAASAGTTLIYRQVALPHEQPEVAAAFADRSEGEWRPLRVG